jgi:hypothetical protein
MKLENIKFYISIGIMIMYWTLYFMSQMSFMTFKATKAKKVMEVTRSVISP